MIQFYRGESSKFESINPILGAGQSGYEIDTYKLKIGDGSTKYNNLPYMGNIQIEIR